VFKVLIHTVQGEMMVLHVVRSLLLLEMMLGMVWMVRNGMVVNVWVVVVMVMMVLHAL
jgi:hypothetical protein